MFKKIIIGGLLVAIAGFGVRKLTKYPTSPSGLRGAGKIEVTDKDWVRGKMDAPITVVEYGDFQCPACGAYYPVLKKLEGEFHDSLRVVYREFPLTTIHANAWGAAVAAEAAGKQGKFWEMHDALFEDQKVWTDTGKFDVY